MFLYMYIAPGQGKTTRWGQNFYINKPLVTLVICSKFLLRPDMTEKLLTGTLSLNTTKSKFLLLNDFFPYKNIREQIWPCGKIGHQPRVIIWTNYDGPNATYQATRSLALWFWRKRFLKDFYHIWAWRPSQSGDPDPANKLSFPYPTEAPYEIWLWLAQRFCRRSLKSVDGRRTMAIL